MVRTAVSSTWGSDMQGKAFSDEQSMCLIRLPGDTPASAFGPKQFLKGSLSKGFSVCGLIFKRNRPCRPACILYDRNFMGDRSHAGKASLESVRKLGQGKCTIAWLLLKRKSLQCACWNGIERDEECEGTFAKTNKFFRTQVLLTWWSPSFYITADLMI